MSSAGYMKPKETKKMENEINIKDLGRWTLVSGILSVLFYLLHDIVGAQYYPGYDWTKQAVSDLTAADAPSFVVASGYATVYKIFSCVCSTFLWLMVKRERKVFRIGVYLFALMNGVSAIGYALFPLSGSGYDGSVQSFIHVYVLTVLVVLLSIVSLILIAVGSFKEKNRLLGILSIVALLCMFFGATGSANMPKEVFGVVERFSTYSAVIFTGVLGIYGFQLEGRRNRRHN